VAVDLVRVDFALIPGEPLFTAVVTASQAITGRFPHNANIIDATAFPPHLSLHICTLPQATLAEVTTGLKEGTAAGLPDIAATTVEPSSSGYVMLTVDRTPQLMRCTRQSSRSLPRRAAASTATPSAAPTSATGSPRTSPWPRSTVTTRPRPPPSPGEP
jgi:hypothetical protein